MLRSTLLRTRCMSSFVRQASLWLLVAAGPATAQTALPDAPSVQVEREVAQSQPSPFPVVPGTVRVEGAGPAPEANDALGPGLVPSNALVFAPKLTPCPPNACSTSQFEMSCRPMTAPFAAFLSLSGPKPMTPRDKLILAGQHVIDPFNLLTIVGSSAIAIGSNSDSVYGPGFHGFARDMGVSFTQDLTGEFFGTFLIPSIVGQDPHFHRMPNASMQRRVAHAFYQIVWTQSDTGRPMFNYAAVISPLADDLVSDLYVPGRRHNAGATTARLATALATDPIDNFVTEFLPDLARHVNIHVAFVQRLIDRVALDQSQPHF